MTNPQYFSPMAKPVVSPCRMARRRPIKHRSASILHGLQDSQEPDQIVVDMGRFETNRRWLSVWKLHVHKFYKIKCLHTDMQNWRRVAPVRVMTFLVKECGCLVSRLRYRLAGGPAEKTLQVDGVLGHCQAMWSPTRGRTHRLIGRYGFDVLFAV